jgi:hypothetical protein
MILSKNAKRMCIFHNEWLLKYVWLKHVPNDNSRAFCNVCTVKLVVNGISRVQNIFLLKPGFCLIKVYYDIRRT